MNNEKTNPVRPWLAGVILAIAALAPATLIGGAMDMGSIGLGYLANGSMYLRGITLRALAGDLPNPQNGAVWLDGSRARVRFRTQSGSSGIPVIVAASVADSDTLVDPVVAKPFSTKAVLRARAAHPGDYARITASGRWSSGPEQSPNLRLGLRVARRPFALAAPVNILPDRKDQAWQTSSIIAVRSGGAAGSVVGTAQCQLGGLLSSPLPSASLERAGETPINLDVDNDVEVMAQFGVSSEANQVTLETLLVELL